jgi:hypothetical protein
MARYSDGDTKQGLTIALVLFVLLSIILGLMAWFGYSEQDAIRTENKKLETEAKTLRLERDKERLLRTIVVIASGHEGPKAEKEALSDLAGLKNKKDVIDNKALSKHFEDELTKLTAKGVKWDPFSDRPTDTFAGRLADLQKQLDAQIKLNKDAKQNLDAETDRYQKDMKALRDSKEKAEIAMADTKNMVDNRIKEIQQDYNKTVDAFQKSIFQAEEYEKKLAALNKEKQEIEARLIAALKDAELKVRKLEEKIPQIDLLAYDKPKGRITRIDINNQTAYVNLGSADFARPGLSFSIFGVGQYKPNAERKGSIEVIDVISDHLSKARITEVKSATRDPVLTGDELYNPAWSPGLREHVAVAGMIDLTGDGRDGTVEFVRNLEKQGVVVDAYLDTRDLSIKGKGITRQTGYLILGEVPEFQAQEQIREGDQRQERKMGINAEMSKMREDAVRLGVTIVPARRFMALMGFQLPRRPATAEQWNAFTIRQTGVGAGPGGQMMPKDMPKEMKKDEK